MCQWLSSIPKEASPRAVSFLQTTFHNHLFPNRHIVPGFAMADGLLGIRDTAESHARSVSRQTLPQVIAPGYVVVSTQSGKAAIVTAAPAIYRGPHSNLITDSATSFTIPLAPTTSPSTSSATTQISSASSIPSPTPIPLHGFSTAKLAAVIVVPLVLLAILSPIAIVWYISWRRKRRAAKRRSDRSSRQPRPLVEHDDGHSGTSRHRTDRASSRPRPSRPQKANRIVSVPTPTFSSFNFELSRPSSAAPIPSSTPQPGYRPIPRKQRSATFSWGSPPPYASPTHTKISSTPVPRLDTPDLPGSPRIETAQMVHVRPISRQHPQFERSSSRLPLHGPARSKISLAPSQCQSLQTITILQPPHPARTRQESADSAAESLHFRSSLQRPFSHQPLASPAMSEISGLSFDPTLWASTMYGSDSIISPIEDQDETDQTRPHQIV